MQIITTWERQCYQVERIWDTNRSFALWFWVFHSLVVWCESNLWMFPFKISQKHWHWTIHYAKCSVATLKKESFLWEMIWRKLKTIARTFWKQHALFLKIWLSELCEAAAVSKEVTSTRLRLTPLSRFEEFSGKIPREKYRDFYTCTFPTVQFEHRHIESNFMSQLQFLSSFLLARTILRWGVAARKGVEMVAWSWKGRQWTDFQTSWILSEGFKII